MIFNEFIGVIKGLGHTIGTEGGCLDRASYERGRGTAVSTVFKRDRSLVYDLFEKYQRMRPKHSWDAADRCVLPYLRPTAPNGKYLLLRSHAFINALQKSRKDLHIDFLYVDEVQDNLLIDTTRKQAISFSLRVLSFVAVLRALCRNPHGLFLAGDTAQTISMGSAFRFNDLKAALYTLEVSVSPPSPCVYLDMLCKESRSYRSSRKAQTGRSGSLRPFDKLPQSWWDHQDGGKSRAIVGTFLPKVGRYPFGGDCPSTLVLPLRLRAIDERTLGVWAETHLLL